MKRHPMFMSIGKISKINIVKITVLPKVIYRFSATSIKTPISFIAELQQTILKFIRNKKIPQITKIILNKKNVRENTIPNLKICYRNIVIRTSMTAQNRYVKQLNKN